jgi:hypothetical protein
MPWPESIDATKEVEIETSRAPGAEVHRTIIWAVVDDGEVYVRSWLGNAGRWYQEILANPDAVLHTSGEAFPVRAIHSPDDASVAHASAGLERKYSDSESLPSMLKDDILHTTLRLERRP